MLPSRPQSPEIKGLERSRKPFSLAILNTPCQCRVLRKNQRISGFAGRTPIKCHKSTSELQARLTNASSSLRGFATPPDRLRRRLMQALAAEVWQLGTQVMLCNSL